MTKHQVCNRFSVFSEFLATKKFGNVQSFVKNSGCDSKGR